MPEAKKLIKLKIKADSVEEAIDKAAKHFDVPEDILEHEVLEKGSKGFIGTFKRQFVVLVWQDPNKEQEWREVKESRDGEFKLQVKKDGVFLTVTKASNRGRAVKPADVMNKIVDKDIKGIESKQIDKIISEASGKPVKIADWTANKDLDSYAEVSVSEDTMNASVNIHAPRLSGRLLDVEEVIDLLKANGVIAGINKERIEEILDNEEFDHYVVVAEGKEPVAGKDAVIDYQFKLDVSDIEFEEDEFGKKDLMHYSLVQNVVETQPLAIKTPPTRGLPGTTVTGFEIGAPDGMDVPLLEGRNTQLSDDGLQVISMIQGQVIFDGERIHVEPVYQVEGSVSLKTGNIVFLGTVIVNGNIEDGFSVKATGDVIVGGNIGECEVESDSNIVVGQGILGKGGGKIHSGGNIIAKFVENSNLNADNDIIVKENILHSNVSAGNRIVCQQGKRSNIVGGVIRASREVNAKNLGSISNTPTKIEVGVDPKAKERLNELEDERLKLEENLHKISINLKTLEKQKLDPEGFTKEKEEMYNRIINAKADFQAQLQSVEKDIRDIKDFINKSENNARISASEVVYPGVELWIRNTSMKVKNEFSFVTFLYDSGNLRPTPYREPEKVEIKDFKEMQRTLKKISKKTSVADMEQEGV